MPLASLLEALAPLVVILALRLAHVREHYIDIGHHEALYDARERGTEEPPIPALPQEMIDRTAQLYASMYERLTGAEF